MNFTIKEINTRLNPLEVYNIFKEEKDTIFLDSSKEDKRLSKYSFIGVNPFLNFYSMGNKSYINNEAVNGDPFNVLEELIKKYKVKIESELPLVSGCMGYIGYDTGRILENLPDISGEDFQIPDMKFVFYNNIIIFDIINNKVFITDLGIENSRIKDIEGRILDGINLIEEEVKISNNKFYSNFTKEEYKKAVKDLKDYIVSGDVYIANMTQRFYCNNNEDSFEIYKKLRTINEAPFSAFMNFEDFQIISSSPERFIQVKEGYVTTRPIKGTRPRGHNEETDNKNKEELLNSEKDKAELLMIVDLERNDLSKVCNPHSVKVTEIFTLEEYATVFHLVSTIEGILKRDVSAVKCIKECFPGGSITGTPKIRAMEIIEELEMLKRNIYTGSIGYFDFRGNADFNIVIRTIVKKDNRAYFGVGGGITYDSIEEDEYNETLDKAKALMRVL
ncbi:aminodeoxychorismate synthase component I [Clostridium gasigenes]|uniref:aminodeoxychorismate synthase component I n=1 Tax=Clostridium gasigenes TaxID=94869 RepID=UPI0014383495|nr:aminodeoxychorismate synthase component I [Clostridium gasigenes]NKF08615.1 aminodeoxychorismate synthase component I [Clostridium gasigenes]QSW18403.1 aminodeoxychorismate synthase component I [Clostridium gasigenes]